MFIVEFLIVFLKIKVGERERFSIINFCFFLSFGGGIRVYFYGLKVCFYFIGRILNGFVKRIFWYFIWLIFRLVGRFYRVVLG